jgi:hypothetical protein
MKNLERVLYLISKGESHNAAAWARLLAKDAFSNNYHLRSFR